MFYWAYVKESHVVRIKSSTLNNVSFTKDISTTLVTKSFIYFVFLARKGNLFLNLVKNILKCFHCVKL